MVLIKGLSQNHKRKVIPPSHQLPSVLEKKEHRAWGRGRQAAAPGQGNFITPWII